MVFLILLTLTVVPSTDCAARNTPFTPSDYQTQIGQGFSTNYFKSNNLDRKYHKKNLQDIYAQGFRNVRLRCRADLDNFNMDIFLTNLERVVDDCLETNVTPIISWIHHEAEAHATDYHRTEYLRWWRHVATRLKDKDYRLSFNLFTELGVDKCGTSCAGSLRENTTKYNDWTRAVVHRIRNSGGNNDKRIIILASPMKTADGLELIDQHIYRHDHHMMAEWHIFASGPNKKMLHGHPGQKYWEGDGSKAGQRNVDSAIHVARDFTTRHLLPTYLGAWMPVDNEFGHLTKREVINFAKYFARNIKPIPWSMNVLNMYYDTTKSNWLSGIQTIAHQSLNMTEVLNEIKSVM